MKFLKSLPKDRLQKLILVVIVSLIGVGVTYCFMVSGPLTELGEQNETITKLNDQLQKAQAEAKAEVANTELRKQFHEFIVAQELRVVDGDSFSWVVREVSLLAEKHPVRVTSLSPGTVASSAMNPRFEGYTTKIEAEGTYDQLGKFISAFENAFPTSSTRGLVLLSTDPVKGICRVNFDVTLLLRPKNSPASPVADTAKKKTA